MPKIDATPEQRAEYERQLAELGPPLPVGTDDARRAQRAVDRQRLIQQFMTSPSLFVPRPVTPSVVVMPVTVQTK